jgi:hypothetical protein
MANTMGHTMRRYLGHKLHLANLAQRKAIMIADDGADPSDAPFWADAPEPEIEDTCDVGDLAYYDDLQGAREHEHALLASAMRCTCAPDACERLEFCQWCDLASTYSDTYKERNGFRPRHHGQWTGIELWDAIHRLYAQPFHD